MRLQVRFQSHLEKPHLTADSLRIGCVPTGAGTPVRFVIVESDTASPLRIDLYSSSEECYAFEDVLLWSSFIAIGWGNHLYLVKPDNRQVTAFDLRSYFGHMYIAENHLLVTSAERLYCIAPNGAQLWSSAPLGIDGVVINSVDGEFIAGQGEWDPPGGLRPFRVSLHDGRPHST